MPPKTFLEMAEIGKADAHGNFGDRLAQVGRQKFAGFVHAQSPEKGFKGGVQLRSKEKAQM